MLMKKDITVQKDLILLRWSREAMKALQDDPMMRGDADRKRLVHRIYSSFFVPVRVDEFHYFTAVEDNEIGGLDNIIVAIHRTLREDLYSFNNVLPSRHRYENSRWAEAYISVDGVIDTTPSHECLRGTDIVGPEDPGIEFIFEEK